jgi:lipoate-protein ligase A
VLREGIARQKVPMGKMLVVKLKYDKRIEELQLQGDFFVFPEDALPKIEAALIGIRKDEKENTIAESVRTVLRENGIELSGITPESIAQTIIMAIG